MDAAPPPSDTQLVERCRRDRDRAAFDALVARHRQRVVGVAFARCRDVGLAEDIAQETFLVAWSALDRLRDTEGAGRWLAGIARNLATSAARTRDRRARVVFVAPERAAEIASDAIDPEAALVEREDRVLFARALGDVPRGDAAILEAYYLEGRSLADIARRDGSTEATAKKRLSRARAAVRRAVAARADRAMDRMRRPLAVAPLGKAFAVMATKHLVIVGAAVILAAGGAAWWLRGSTPPAATEPAAPPAPATTGTSPGAAATSAAVAPPRDAARAAELHVGRIDRTTHDQLLAQIRAAHARNVAATRGGGGASPPPPSLGSGSDAPYDRAYIKAAVQEILPMLGDCYAEGLQRNPELAPANVVVEFSIEGEQDVGGVIGDSKIDDAKTDLADAQVRECIQETMYALQLDPPPGGGAVKVRYPFAFAPPTSPAP